MSTINMATWIEKGDKGGFLPCFYCENSYPDHPFKVVESLEECESWIAWKIKETKDRFSGDWTFEVIELGLHPELDVRDKYLPTFEHCRSALGL